MRKERATDLWVCVSGFLGQSSDFSFLPQGHGFRVWSMDLLANDEVLQYQNLAALAAALDQQLTQYLRDQNSVMNVHFLGYSFGARLGLEWAVLAPGRFQSLLFTPLSMGGSGMDEPSLLPSDTKKNKHSDMRRERLERDLEWGLRFEDWDWDELISSWNAQAIFQSPSRVPEPLRLERDFSRAACKHALRAFSPAANPSPESLLTKLHCPIELWVGEEDVGTLQRTQKVLDLWSRDPECETPIPTLKVLPHCGHRLLWEARDALVERLAIKSLQ